MRLGTIPSSVRITSALPCAFKCTWDGLERLVSSRSSVSYSYVANADPNAGSSSPNVTSLSNGTSTGSSSSVGYARSRLQHRDEVVEHNEPRRLTLLGYTCSDQGTRTYKAIDGKNRVFDVNEDVMLDAILSRGLGEGGRFNCRFVFADVEGKVQLVRVDSVLHKAICSGVDAPTGPVQAGSLTAGGVYRHGTNTFLYLGRVDSVEHVSATSEAEPLSSAGRREHGKLAGRAGHKLAQARIDGEYLTIPIARFQQADPARALKNALAKPIGDGLVRLNKSLHVDSLVQTIAVPPNVLEQLRERALETVTDNVKSLAHAKMVDCYGEDGVRQMQLDAIFGASSLLNLRPHGAGSNVSAETNELFGSVIPAQAA